MESAGPEATIHEVMARYRDRWMARPEVTGMGIGRCEDRPCIVVYLLREPGPDRAGIPERVEGYRVRLEVTGRMEPRTPGRDLPARPNEPSRPDEPSRPNEP